MADLDIKLPSGWILAPLHEVADIVFSNVDKKTVSGEVPVRLCNYVDVFHNRYITNDLNFMDGTATPKEMKRFALRRGDVVFTKDSETADEIAIASVVRERLTDVVCGYHLGIARSRGNRIIGAYLAQAFRHPTIHHQFVRLANGVTRFGLTLGAVFAASIPVPPLAEQRRIAEILNTWDRAIGVAESIRERVEQLYNGAAAQKIRFRGENMQLLGMLLSPDRMQKVEPNGAFRALGVRSHGKGTFQRTDDLSALGSNKTVYRVEPNRFIVNIVFAWEGAAAITSTNDAGCLVSHRFPTFSINEKLLHRDYFRHMIRMKPFRQLLALASPGGAGRNKTLNRHDLLRFAIHVPSLEQQERVATALMTLDHRLQLLDRYLECLISQREALATKLVTGRLRVRNVKQTVAAS